MGGGNRVVGKALKRGGRGVRGAFAAGLLAESAESGFLGLLGELAATVEDGEEQGTCGAGRDQAVGKGLENHVEGVVKFAIVEGGDEAVVHAPIGAEEPGIEAGLFGGMGVGGNGAAVFGGLAAASSDFRRVVPAEGRVVTGGSAALLSVVEEEGAIRGFVLRGVRVGFRGHEDLQVTSYG